jgi:aerobic carbon-monoxide dehydrogenase small subunit
LARSILASLFAARSVSDHSPGSVQPKEDRVSISLSFTVNDKKIDAEVDPRTLLVEFIRENLRLTGTHVGCDTGQCGACTVLVDGVAVKSCTILAVQANGSAIGTIEGLAAPDGELHPMQAAFKDCHGLQCGFCTPGMVLSAIDLVARHPGADEATIRAELEGNMCRCTGYHNIVKAVKQGAAAMGK